MKPELIVMLTYNDRTVENALELFNELKDLSATYWGFKDVGLDREKMKALVQAMRVTGKKTCLEVVSLSEGEGLDGARLASESDFDILMGTVFFDSINEYVKDLPLAYYPFPGHVHSHPSILDGTIDEIVSHARQLEAKGVDGLDLLGYRFTGDAAKLLSEVVEATTIPVICAGSIASFERIDEVEKSGAWGFTIGTAFFEKQFVPDGSLRDNVQAVIDRLGKMEREGNGW